MTKLEIPLISLIVQQNGRTFYVDATGGNDSNDGKSTASAWQTITKINAETFQNEDKVLFKRGETWDNGTVGRNLVPPSSVHMTFGAYGSGADPVIDAGASGSPSVQLNVDYVTVQNLELVAATVGGDHNVFLNGCNHCIIQNCTIHGGYDVVAISDEGGVTTDGNKILNNEVYTSLNEGIYVKNISAINGTSNTLISGNTIYSTTAERIQHTYGAPADQSPTGTIIEHNTVVGGGDQGAMQIWGDAIIRYNDIYGGGAGSGATYAIIELEEGSSSQIYNNLFYDFQFNNANTTGGIYVTDTVSGASIYHNTFYNITNTGSGTAVGIITVFGSSGVTIKNNCISGCDDQMLFYGSATADSNAVYGTTDETGTNAVTTDPLLVNAGTDDFHLQSSSPCRGAGATGTGVTDDYDGVTRGSPPDIGAYEYVA